MTEFSVLVFLKHLGQRGKGQRPPYSCGVWAGKAHCMCLWGSGWCILEATHATGPVKLPHVLRFFVNETRLVI